MEVDIIDGEVVWNELMRIRIKLDVSKPLVCKKKIIIGDGEVVWVRLAYEHLLEFCYYCGIIGHCHKECSEWMLVKDRIGEENLPYSPWLRVQIQGVKIDGSKQQRRFTSNSPFSATGDSPSVIRLGSRFNCLVK